MTTSENNQMNPENLPKRMVAIGGGGVGGIGKTTFALSCIDWYLNDSIPFQAFDAEPEDKPKGRLSCFFPDITKLDLRAENELDTVARSAWQQAHRLTILDLGAGAGSVFVSWVLNRAEVLRELNVRVTLVSVLTPATQTFASFGAWVNKLEDRVQYLVVRNHKEGGKFLHIDESKAGLDFRKEYSPTIIDMPRRSSNETRLLEGASLSPQTAINLYRSGKPEDRDRLGARLADPFAMAQIEVETKKMYSELATAVEVLLP